METVVTCERPALAHAEAKPIMFMVSIQAPLASLPVDKGAGKSPVAGAERTPRPPPPRGTSAAGTSSAAAPPLGELSAAATAASLLDVCCLEGCGLRWRVRPPLLRRSPWTVSAQRMRLCIEALNGAKVEKVFTLLDHHELAPCISYEVCVGDLHAGDSCHVPVLVWLPALSAAMPHMEAVRFSLQYVDAVKIETKTAELTAGVARPMVRDRIGCARMRMRQQQHTGPGARAACAACVGYAAWRRAKAASAAAPVARFRTTSPLHCVSLLPRFPLSLARPHARVPCIRRPTLCSHPVSSSSRSLVLLRLRLLLLPSQPGESSQLAASPPIALDRERNRVLVAEALQRAALVANNGNLEAACLLLVEVNAMLQVSPSTLARDALSQKLIEVTGAALRRLDEVAAEFKCRNGGASHLDRHNNPGSLIQASPGGNALALRGAESGSSQQPPLVNVLLGSTISPTDGRAPLKPRTFSVSLPFSSLGPGGAARADNHNPSATFGGSHQLSLSDHGSSSGGGGAGGGGAGGFGGANSGYLQPWAAASSTLGETTTAWQRRGVGLLQLRDSSESSNGAGGAGGAGEGGDSANPSSSAREPSLRAGSNGLLTKAPPPLRLLSGAVSFAGGKKGGKFGGALRGRPPRLQPPVLMPLHAPPLVRDGHGQMGLMSTSALGSPPLGIGTQPLPPAGASAIGKQGPYESWLCRLLRTPLRPLPLPDELIAHIFSFLEPSVLFHDSLTLPALVVDKCTTTVRGHYTTISAALRAASPGDRLLIKPGVYRESLRIEVPVMLLGCPGVGNATGAGVTITSSRNHTVHSTASFARMENITLRQTGSSGRSCLLVSSGRLDVSDCDISSASGLCVEVTDTAAPSVRHSRIHGGAAAGLWFRAGGSGLVEGNEIWGNGWSGVQISDESNPTLLRNYIHDNKSAGIISFNHGKGVAKHNDITSNGKGGVQVRSRACPELVCNRIFAERSFGVWVYEHGLGKFEDNDIVNNAWSGFQVEEGSAPNVVGNRLRGNRSAGIVVYNRGSGTYEWNDISCNGRCGVQIKSGSAPTFRHNRIHHEKQAGVLTAEDGTGVLEDNDIYDNQWSGVQTEGPSNPLLRHNRIHHNGGAGFIAYQNGSGLLESNNIYGNKKYGVQSKTGGHPTVRLNKIHDKVYGIYLTESGGGIYEENRIHNIRGTGIYVSSDCSPVLSNNHGTQ